MNQLIKENKMKPVGLAKNMTVGQGKLFINGEEYAEKITPPTVDDIRLLKSAD